MNYGRYLLRDAGRRLGLRLDQHAVEPDDVGDRKHDERDRSRPQHLHREEILPVPIVAFHRIDEADQREGDGQQPAERERHQVEAVARGELANAYALCRPPGHHAGMDFFGGYCFLNNAALAAEHLRAAGLKRVAVLDVDAPEKWDATIDG